MALNMLGPNFVHQNLTSSLDTYVSICYMDSRMMIGCYACFRTGSSASMA